MALVFEFDDALSRTEI